MIFYLPFPYTNTKYTQTSKYHRPLDLKHPMKFFLYFYPSGLCERESNGSVQFLIKEKLKKKQENKNKETKGTKKSINSQIRRHFI